MAIRCNKNKDLKQAIEEAIDRCMKEDILREFLIVRRAEVVKEMELDYTFERRIELTRRDSRAEGMAKGQKISALKMLEMGKLTIGEIAECTDLSIAEVEQLAALRSEQ